MLPVSENWYRRLLLVALVLGVGGGVAALGYSAFTGFGQGFFFGDPTSDPWSGEWWWIPLVSGGAVLVVALRSWWSVPEKVPGAVACARRGWVDPSSALSLFAVSAISLFVGASLGPSFGIIVSAGGLGSWVISRSERPAKTCSGTTPVGPDRNQLPLPSLSRWAAERPRRFSRSLSHRLMMLIPDNT